MVGTLSLGPPYRLRHCIRHCEEPPGLALASPVVGSATKQSSHSAGGLLDCFAVAMTVARDSLLSHRGLGQQFRDLDCVQGSALQKLIGGDEHRDRMARGIAEILADAAD